jgi:hypothetical protein
MMSNISVLIGVSAGILPRDSTVVQAYIILNLGGKLMTDTVCCCY